MRGRSSARRKPQGVRLYGRSRDVDEIDKATLFNTATCRWTILGETADVRRSKERQQVLDVLTDEPMALKDIAKIVGKSLTSAPYAEHLGAEVASSKRHAAGQPPSEHDPVWLMKLYPARL